MISAKKILSMKSKEKIACLTSYDCYSAKFLDEAGIDLILVGDSAANVVLGYDKTTKITLDDMKVFTKAVVNGAKNALVVADMPFLSYHAGVDDAVKNAGELIRLGAGAVKIEGCNDYILNVISRLVESGIPVMGHLGFTPQYINVIGGNFVQGKNIDNTIKILNDAKELCSKGIFSLVLEMVPDLCAKYITENIDVPTIGIGAGKYCDGQILVLNDIIGKFDSFHPKFSRKYVDSKELIKKAASGYINDVKTGDFPNYDESFHLTKEEEEKLENYSQN